MEALHKAFLRSNDVQIRYAEAVAPALAHGHGHGHAAAGRSC